MPFIVCIAGRVDGWMGKWVGELLSQPLVSACLCLTVDILCVPIHCSCPFFEIFMGTAAAL